MFILAGLVVLGDVLAATIISAVLIGICAIVGGIFEISHAFWTKGWGGFFWQILLGVLYIIAGVSLVSQPAVGSILLTYVLGIVLLVSGAVRIFVGFRNWESAGWLLTLSGLFGILAGFVILSGWPATGLWVIGFLLGIDLLSHGLGWLLLALRPSPRTA
ncbi:MAG: HdeD family acid-resistance protein [Bradyrhizobium sp.]